MQEKHGELQKNIQTDQTEQQEKRKYYDDEAELAKETEWLRKMNKKKYQ